MAEVLAMPGVVVERVTRQIQAEAVPLTVELLALGPLALAIDDDLQIRPNRARSEQCALGILLEFATVRPGKLSTGT